MVCRENVNIVGGITGGEDMDFTEGRAYESEFSASFYFMFACTPYRVLLYCVKGGEL